MFKASKTNNPFLHFIAIDFDIRFIQYLGYLLYFCA